MDSPQQVLQQVSVASPCPAAWENMVGDERVRFCGHCQKRVYNLSAMTALEAADFVSRNSERPCVRFFQRADGTLLTQDCPVGLAALRRRLRGAIMFGSAAVVAIVAHGIAAIGLSCLLRRAPGAVSYMTWNDAAPEVSPQQDAGDHTVGNMNMSDPVLALPANDLYIPPIELDVHVATELTGVLAVISPDALKRQ